MRNDGFCDKCKLPIAELLFLLGDGPVCSCPRPKSAAPICYVRKPKRAGENEAKS